MLVSINCAVYNHEAFLRQCLDGILMQQTDFRLEVIVHDDASTDNSVAIIREYTKKYPEIIKPIFQTENQYSKHDGTITRIMAQHTNGDYIAYCEGDDYWTDPHKLQKQVDYMESHPECMLCFHNVMQRYEDEPIDDRPFAILEDRDYTADELILGWIAQTASFVVRRTAFKQYESFASSHPRLAWGDGPLCFVCASLGTVHAFPEIMSVYRHHAGGYTRLFSASKMYAEAKSWRELIPCFDGAYKNSFRKKMTSTYMRAMILGVKHRDFKTSARAFWYGLVCHPSLSIAAVRQIIKERRIRLATIR